MFKSKRLTLSGVLAPITKVVADLKALQDQNALVVQANTAVVAKLTAESTALSNEAAEAAALSEHYAKLVPVAK